MYGDHEGEEEDPFSWHVFATENGQLYVAVTDATGLSVTVHVTRGMLKAMLGEWHAQYRAGVSDSYVKATQLEEDYDRRRRCTASSCHKL